MVAVATALLAGVTALGGFNDVPVQALPSIEVGETYTTNEVEVTVLSVELSAGAPFDGYESEGYEYVVVEVEATALTDDPNRFSRELIAVLLEGVISPDDSSTSASVVELRNGDSSVVLQPGLPVLLAYSWKIETGLASPGDEIIVGIFERRAVPDDARFDDLTVSVPVVRIVTELEAAR